MQMQMAGHAVDVDGGQLGLDEGAGIVMECFGHMHAVRADPVIRHALFQVGNLLHIYHLGFGAVRHIRNAADGAHLTGFAAVSSFPICGRVALSVPTLTGYTMFRWSYEFRQHPSGVRVWVRKEGATREKT